MIMLLILLPQLPRHCFVHRLGLIIIFIALLIFYDNNQNFCVVTLLKPQHTDIKGKRQMYPFLKSLSITILNLILLNLGLLIVSFIEVYCGPYSKISYAQIRHVLSKVSNPLCIASCCASYCYIPYTVNHIIMKS